MMNQKPNDSSLRAINLALATFAGQAGCLSLVIVIVALLAGLWLDSQFGVKGPFTVGLLLLSVPLSLFVMVRIALSSVKNIKTPPNKGDAQSQKSTYVEEKDL